MRLHAHTHTHTHTHTYTHTHTHIHTHTYIHTDFADKNIFKKPGVCQPIVRAYNKNYA